MEGSNMERVLLSNQWKIVRVTSIGIGLLFFLFTTTICLLFLIASYLPKPSLFMETNSTYYDRNGDFLATTKIGYNRKIVSLRDLPPYAINIILQSEDRIFYEHHGFDFKRIGAALWTDLSHLKLQQGASTITQQLAKNLYLSPEKTWKRKISEAFLTMRLEQHYSKNTLLSTYLNTIYFGHGVYGIEAASQFYFNKRANQLTLGETSFILSIPANPSLYDPYQSFKLVKKRQEQSLASLVKNHVLSAQQASQASDEKITLIQNNNQKLNFASYFLQEANKEASQRFSPNWRVKGISLYTTIDTNIQKIIEKTVKSELAPYPSLQSGVIVMDSKTGEIVGMAGNRTEGGSYFNYATDAKRQPGSAIKPFLYYAALENGFTPSSRLKSEPTTFYFQDRSSYHPKNYGNSYANAEITMAQAIAVSDNIYAVKTQQAIGEKAFTNALKTFQLPFPNKVVPSLALGTNSVNLLELTRAYAMIANGGKSVNIHYIKRAVQNNGSLLVDTKIKNKQVLSKENVMILKELLHGMFNPAFSQYTPVTGTSIIPLLTKTYYGKSGTTNTDSWMIGFHSNIVVGVWVGSEHNKQLTTSEQKIAKQIWAKTIQQIGESSDLSVKSENVEKIAIDVKTGLLYKKGCSEKVNLYFRKGTAPSSVCTKKMKLEKPKEAWYEAYLLH
jgi:membrane peptidoglycan carboxypeptidase